MTELEIKKARIMSLHPSGIKAMVDGKQGFIRRWNIDWKEPYIDFYSLYRKDDVVDVAILGKDREYDDLSLSIKHAKYNPWRNLEKYKKSLDRNAQTDVKGIVKYINFLGHSR